MSQESRRLYGILAASAGGVVALQTIINAPQNETGADLFMQSKKLELKIDESRSNAQIMMYEGRIFEIQQDPNYKEFRRQNNRNMAEVGVAGVVSLAGVAIALSSGEMPSRLKFPKFPKSPHKLRGNRT